MAKHDITLHIPEPKIRRKQPKPVSKHRDKTKYSRKTKQSPFEAAVSFLKRIS